MYVKKEEIYSTYLSKHNTKGVKKVILLMIPNGEKRKAKSEGLQAKSKGQQWHFLPVKKLLSLLRGIRSKHCGNFYCLNCLPFFRTKKTTSIT